MHKPQPNQSGYAFNLPCNRTQGWAIWQLAQILLSEVLHSTATTQEMAVSFIVIFCMLNILVRLPILSFDLIN